jgi:hypothetical protein
VSTRYRCTACGNLTRFDVVRQRRTRAFHHYTVGGDLQVEDEEVLDEVVEDVSCRWCGSGAAVETIASGAETTGAGDRAEAS